MLTKMVNGISVILTQAEEDTKRAEWLSNATQAASDATKLKRDTLIQWERDNAVEFLITAEKVLIENMDEAALDAALSNKGIPV